MRPNSKESVMLEQYLPQWLLDTGIILGWDDPDEEEEEEPDPDEEEEEGEEADDEEEEEDDKPKSKTKKSAAARQLEEAEQSLTKVKATLRKERNLRKEAQRKLKEAGISTSSDSGGGSGGDKGSKQDAQAQREAEEERRKSAEREKRLATRVATQAVDTVIIRLAPSFGFMDVDDAVRLVNRKDVDVDQDDDDPAIIDVDEDDVKRALRALAKSKPHLLKPKEGKKEDEGGGGDGKPKTGSKFNSKKDKNATNLEDLKKRFPALNH
jgi:pyruvate/2-oxoglutarate dehydrogenase complex dihydrolipoamide acyltransferase (E2) component